MNIVHYDVGDKPIVTATFADVAGGTGVSTAVIFIVRSPSDAETTYTNGDAEVTAVGTNVWALAMPRIGRWGDWHVRAESTAGLQAAVEHLVSVRRSAFANP